MCSPFLEFVRRQDPDLAKDKDERIRIQKYRKAVELAAVGKISESFERLDQIGVVVDCNSGDQAKSVSESVMLNAERQGNWQAL